MRQTSVRKTGHAAGNLAHLDRAERIAVLREKMTGMVASESQVQARKIVAEQDYLSVPQEFAEILPMGGLLRGELVDMADSAMVVAQLIAHISGNGSFVAVVGWPSLSLAGVKESGGDLRKIIVIPNPQDQALNIVTMLAEGVDLVVYRHAGQSLTPSQARPLLAKLRAGRAAVLAVGLDMPTHVVRLAATVSGFRGIGNGSGRIYAVDFTLCCRAKGNNRYGRITIGRQRDLAVV